MSEYTELLKLPAWQKKRLEIFNRDGFRCQHCDTDQVSLNVHHKEYIRGRMPWDYEDSNFETLCETCHKLLHFPPPQIEQKVCTGFIIIDQEKEAYNKAMGELMRQLSECSGNMEQEISIMKQIRELQLTTPKVNGGK